jgi:hypothetical protein
MCNIIASPLKRNKQKIKNIMKKILLIAILCNVASNCFALQLPFGLLNSSLVKNKAGQSYITADDDGLIFSRLVSSNFTSNTRFSSFFNSGFHYNYNVTKGVALFTGLTIKNVGYSSRSKTNVYRARNYFVGIPVGLRLGNFKQMSEISVGGGVDFTLHHKEKYWTIGDKRASKKKINCEWFDNTHSNFINPFLFASAKYKGVGAKVQYYTTTFYKNGVGNLMYISLILPSGNSGKGFKANSKTKKIKKSINSI